MGVGGWVAIIVVVSLVIVIVQVIVVSNKQTAMKNKVERLPNFSSTQEVMGCNGESGIAVDDRRRKICLITNRQTVSQRVLSYKDIISVELVEDGATITQTVRSSQIAGAVVGGLMLGGAGAIIGGLSGKSKTSGKVKSVALRVTVNDSLAPLHEVKFLLGESKKDSHLYTSAITRARHWAGVLEVLIKQADSDERAKLSQSATPSTPKLSVADELKKLVELRDTNVLTPDEFQQMKKALLSGGTDVR